MAAGMAMGSVIQGMGAYQSSQANANALDAQADLQIKNAQEAEAQGQLNAQKQQINSSLKVGEISANYAASGVTSTSGSVLNVLGASAANSEMDRLNILHGADIKAITYENQASMERAGAQSARGGAFLSALGIGASTAGKIYGNSMGGSGSGYNPSADQSEFAAAGG